MNDGDKRDELDNGDDTDTNENSDIENRINEVMDKIVVPEDEYGEISKDASASDEDAEIGEIEESDQPVRRRKKSARPGAVVYVPMDDFDNSPNESKKKNKKKSKKKTQESVDDAELQTHNGKKSHKGLRIFGLVAAGFIVVAGCAYAGISYYFADRFFEGTWINGVNCSQMTASEVEQLFENKFQNYSIEVSGRNADAQTINGSDISYQYLSTGEVLKLLKQQKPYEWIKGLYEQKTYTVAENTGYNKTLLQEKLKSLNCAQAENQTAPENAYVAFQNGQFVIVPETEGSELDLKAAYKVLDEAISNGETSVNFADTPDAYVSADVTSDDEGLKSTLEACNNYTKASITYTFGDQTVTLDGNTIKDWLQFDDKGQLVWDDTTFQQYVTEYVAQLAATYDTVGTEREFQTTSGRTVYVSSSIYGWKIDQASEVTQLCQEIQSGTVTTRDPIYSQTANAYGTNDLGSTYIEVDLSEQHMYYYQNGVDVFESDFVSGNMSYSDRQTHEGIFTLYYKKSPDVLRGSKKDDGTYEYEETVQYWMPFDGGIGFHDASWRDEFGGDIYLTNGSHGCINMPTDSAAELYNLIDYNVPIICFY